MPIDSVQTLIVKLKQYHLLEPSQYDELTRSLSASFPEPIRLSRELVQRGWLTPYQVNQLFQGKDRQLLLGSYVLLEKLSEGPMGDVFKARHMHMRRVVALQVIRPEVLQHPGAVERFYAEVQAASLLSHPHLVASFDAGPVDNTHFFAMEFLEGIDLERHVEQSGPLPLIQACEFVRQVALALQHASQRGLRHHDLNPSNLLLVQSRGGDGALSVGTLTWGLVKVRNLGLTIIRQPTKHTRLNLQRATAADGPTSADFMAPERGQGTRPGDIRSDLYNLGCTFYFLLTGQVPFPGGTAEDKHRRHLQQMPEPLEHLRPAVPAEVRAIVARLMAKRPEQRYQTPAEVAAALAALPAHVLAASADERQAWERRREMEQRRSRRLLLVASAGLAVGLLLFSLLLYRKLSAGSAAATAPEAAPPSRGGPRLAECPALAVHCGRRDGWPQYDVTSADYLVERTQGGDGPAWGPPAPWWPNGPAGLTYSWSDNNLIRFLVRTPRYVPGQLRLFFLDGDTPPRRRQRVQVGKAVRDLENFSGKGQELVFDVTPHDTRDGALEVTITNTSTEKDKPPSVVISRVEFVPLVSPDDPPPAPGPALRVQCGRGGGGNQDEIISKGYLYHVSQAAMHDGWGAPAAKSHCWNHGGSVKFELYLPPAGGKLRLHFVDPDSDGTRKQRLVINGKPIREFADFGDPKGLWFEHLLTAADVKAGKVDVEIQNLNRQRNAVVSTVEVWPEQK